MEKRLNENICLSFYFMSNTFRFYFFLIFHGQTRSIVVSWILECFMAEYLNLLILRISAVDIS